MNIYSRDNILKNKYYLDARLCYIDGNIHVYENYPMLREWVRDIGRLMLFDIILCLWGGYREDDRDSWPTVQRIKSEMMRFNIASPRQIDKLITRLSGLGMVILTSTEQDARVRLILPSDSMIATDLALLRIHYPPLHILFADEKERFSPVSDEKSQRAFRQARLEFLPHVAEQVLKQNKPVMRFLTRAFGAVMLMKLIRHFAVNDLKNFTSTKAGEFLGASHVQVRNIMLEAQENDDIHVDKDEGIQLKPSLLTAFDRLVADGLAVTIETHIKAMAILKQAA